MLDEDLLVRSEADAVGVPLYTHITGSAGALGASGLRTMEFLRCLRRVDGRFYVSNNADLESVAGLERLESVNYVSVHDNPKLESLDALESLHTIEDYALVDDNPALHTLGLNQLERVRRLEIGEVCYGAEGNPALTNLGLNSLAEFDFLLIAGNASLTAIDGLSGLDDRITPNPAGPPPWFSIQVRANENLAADHVHEVLDPAVEAGSIRTLTVLCNKDQPPCEPCPQD